MVSPDSRANLARRQAEDPLNALCKNPSPALCEPPFEERSAGNLHATICGIRGWVTTSGDPVLVVKLHRPTRPFGRCYSPKAGRAYIGARPSKKSIAKVRRA